MCRFFQYFTKFIIPFLAAKGDRYKDLHDRLKNLNQSMGMTRKVLRFGRQFPVLKNLLDRIKQHESKPVRMILTRTLSDLSLFIYYFLDHPLYFHKIGLFKM